MVIDGHVHYTPPALRDRLLQQAEEEPYWNLLLNSPRSIQGWVTAEQMIDAMDRAAIDKVVLMGEYFQQHSNCVRRNDEVLSLMARWPQRILGFAIVQPLAAEAAVAEAQRCLDAGMLGIGELNPYAQRFDLASEQLAPLIELCIARQAPINLHVSEAAGDYYLGRSSTPLDLYYALALKYPQLKLILAHWGGGLLFYELMPRARRRLRNVWYDTAASPLLYPTTRIVRTALSCVDARKIVYGSDYPLRVYPRKQREPEFSTFISELRAQLTPEEADAVLGTNIARLIGLHEPFDAAAASSGTAPAAALDRISGWITVHYLLTEWPETRPLLAHYGISEGQVRPWEPLLQAAAARGLGPRRQRQLLDQLNAIIYNLA